MLAAANKRDNDEKTLKYHSMDFSDFKNQWIEHRTNIPKFPGSPAFEFNNEKNSSTMMLISFYRKVGHFQRKFIVFDLQAQQLYDWILQHSRKFQ